MEIGRNGRRTETNQLIEQARQVAYRLHGRMGLDRVWFMWRLHPLPTLPISTAKHNNPKCAEGRGRLQFNHVVVCFLPRNTQKPVSSDTKGGWEKTSSPCFNHDSTSPRPINGRDGRVAILCARVHRRTVCGRAGARPSQRGQTLMPLWIKRGCSPFPADVDAPNEKMPPNKIPP